MSRRDGNECLDIMLKNFKEYEKDQLGAPNSFYLDKLMKYGFSPERYEYLFTQVHEITLIILKKASELCNPGQRKALSSSPKLLLERAKSSSSVYINGKTVEKAYKNWLSAAEYCSQIAKKAPESKLASKEFIKQIHFLITKGEVGVKHPGSFRFEAGDVPIVRVAGDLAGLCCPTKNLSAPLDSFLKWYEIGLTLCEVDKLNPIIFAAQAYKRLVSLHPFENGNKRVARLLMDYTLERFGIPPPILGEDEDVLDVVRGLNVKQNGEKFIEKIIKGIKKAKLL